MDEENNRPQRHVSRSFILSILFVAGIIALIVYLIVSNLFGKPYEMGKAEFVNLLYENKITEIQKVDAQNMVTISGRYVVKTDSTGHPITAQYTVSFQTSEFEMKTTTWNVDIKKADGSFGQDGTIDEVNIAEIIIYAKASYPTIKYHDDVNPYRTTWWDHWGPTIIIVGGSALLFLLLFSRMSSTVNASNRQAMDFNRSRARRANSKVKFDDVAGADEEKNEM